MCLSSTGSTNASSSYVGTQLVVSRDVAKMAAERLKYDKLLTGNMKCRSAGDQRAMTSSKLMWFTATDEHLSVGVVVYSSSDVTASATIHDEHGAVISTADDVTRLTVINVATRPGQFYFLLAGRQRRTPSLCRSRASLDFRFPMCRWRLSCGHLVS